MNAADVLDHPQAEAAHELVDIAEIKDGKPLVNLSLTQHGLAQLRTHLQGRTYDLRTVAGDKAARSDRMLCVTLRASVEKRRRVLKAPALEFGRQIDAEAARIVGEVEALEAPIDAQIKVDEDRREAERKARAEAEALRLSGLCDVADAVMAKWVARCTAEGMTSERVAGGLIAFAGVPMPIELSEVQEHWDAAHWDAMHKMTAIRDDLARQEDAARAVAQRLEFERVAAEQRAEADRLDALRLAQEAAQRAEAERHDKRAAKMHALADAIQAERDKLAAEKAAAAAAAAPEPEAPAPTAPTAPAAEPQEQASLYPLEPQSPPPSPIQRLLDLIAAHRATGKKNPGAAWWPELYAAADAVDLNQNEGENKCS